MSEVRKTTEFLSKAGFKKLTKEVNKKQKYLSSMPESSKDGEVVLYSGESTSEFKKGHCYKATVNKSFISVDESFSQITNKNNIWTDGIDYYYSLDEVQLKFNKSQKVWENFSWDGFSPRIGCRVWTDGINTYYSDVGPNNDQNLQYILIKGKWVEKEWNVYDQQCEFKLNGLYIWNSKNETYYSPNRLIGTAKDPSFILDKVNSKWTPVSWEKNYMGGNVSYIWHDLDNNTYLSHEDQQYQLINGNWVEKDWNGLEIDGRYIWNDGKNVYYSLDDENYYVLVDGNWIKSELTFEGKARTGFWFNGIDLYYFPFNGTPQKIVDSFIKWVDISLDSADEISYENSIEETSVTTLKEAVDKLVLLEKEIRDTLSSIQKLIPLEADENNQLVANSQINYSAGASNKPVYLENGKLKECSHTLDQDILLSSKLTDTIEGKIYEYGQLPDSTDKHFATNGTVKNVQDELAQSIGTINSSLSSLDQQFQSFKASPKIPLTAQSGEGAIWIE